MKNWIISDLDGTIALIDERRKLADRTPPGAKKRKMDWRVFFDPKNIWLDKPNTPVIQALLSFNRSNYDIAIYSGRSDATKDETVKWLDKYSVPFDYLIMRPRELMYKKDVLLKKDWLEDPEILPMKEEVEFVLDDRNAVVEMWRELGLSCFQVAEGNF